ncbi:hypothetical protein LIER_02199 [Lithospermum erythrorhizon]|uniref:Uncharacterized protein n=1 Tax=Lithospermum erythrorhizon TaxID=34254 RepID=A0AAV3NP10_LITER
MMNFQSPESSVESLSTSSEMPPASPHQERLNHAIGLARIYEQLDKNLSQNFDSKKPKGREGRGDRMVLGRG